jgi:hypothetical protein
MKISFVGGDLSTRLLLTTVKLPQSDGVYLKALPYQSYMD